MPAYMTNTIVASNSTDAAFRGWVSFIVNSMIAGGWVQTADSGQINLVTAARPTISNGKAGYVVMRMNDALQAANPVFVRFDFGNGSTVNSPAMWFTLGTGSDGAGAITGMIFNGGAVAQGQVTTAGTNNLTANNSYASADASRLHLLLFQGSAMFIFSLERGRTLAGAEDGSLLYLSWGSGSGSIGALDKTQVFVRTGGASPPVEFGATVTLSNQATSAFSSDVGIGLVVHFKGIAQPIGLGAVAVNSGDFLAEAQITMAVYGVNHTYVVSLNAGSTLYIPNGGGTNTLRNSTRVGIRYD